MTNSYIQAAFNDVCAEAKVRESWFVSLYKDESWYGGPEEGGWWGNTSTLEAYQEFPTEEAAEAARAAVEEMAEVLSKKAERRFGQACLRETAWLEARGLEDVFLPEVDGPDRYFVVVEERPGSAAYSTDPHWE